MKFFYSDNDDNPEDDFISAIVILLGVATLFANIAHSFGWI